MTKTQAEAEKRDQHVENAIAYMVQVMIDAELRGLSGADVAVSLAGIIAARNATLAGKCLEALRMAILRNPVTKIIEATALPDAVYGVPDGSNGKSH